MSKNRRPKFVWHAWLLLAAIWLLTCTAGCQERPAPAGNRSDVKQADAKAADRADDKAAAASGTVAPAVASQAVQLVIDYGDGAQKRFAAIPYRDGMTVLDVLEAAKSHSHGITFVVRGSGEMTLLTRLDDVANQEGATGAKNWIFYVNDKMADKSLGVRTVNLGDIILWKFERYVE